MKLVEYAHTPKCLSFFCVVFIAGFSVPHAAFASQSDSAHHLFILSGQSNMAGLRPEESFIPNVEEAFGKDHVIVVKDALGGQPIRRWYKNWEAADGSRPESTGDLYQRLMEKVQQASTGKEIQTVSFIWMQGERDAKEEHGKVYEASLEGLLKQVSGDLERDDINVVIGRLSDFDMNNTKYAHWTLVREQQAAFVQDGSRRTLVNTDDLNDGVNRRGKEIRNDLHYSAQGYVELGRRFAKEAIRLIEASNGLSRGQ